MVRYIFVLLCTIGLSALVVSTAFTGGLISEDGRLNQVAHFGGDVLYCVDAGGSVTDSYEGLVSGGQFRLLNVHGAILWSLPVNAITGDGLMDTGQGTYGPVTISTYATENGQAFTFTGYDEHGKANAFSFLGCNPVNPPSSHHAASTTMTVMPSITPGGPTATLTPTFTPTQAPPTATLTPTFTPTPSI